jgi:D-lactate dehydrogenase
MKITFFAAHSLEIIEDELFQRLTRFPNVLITGHQGFFTVEAMTEIARVTLENLRCLANGETTDNLLHAS